MAHSECFFSLTAVILLSNLCKFSLEGEERCLLLEHLLRLKLIMVEENMVTEKVVNGTSLLEKTVKAATEKKEEQNGIKEMEEDKKIDKSETAKMDEDTEPNEDKESKEETEKEESEEQKTEAMEEDASPSEKEATELKDGAKDEVEGEADVDKKKEDKDEEKAESKAAKGSKKRGKGKSEEKVKEKTKKVEEKKDPEPRTPATDRPVRERKSVERLVASIEKEAVKEFQIEKVFLFSLVFIPYNLNCSFPVFSSP